MRLLQRLPDDSGFSLVEHEENNIPPYAILSHTWGSDEDEVTFKDIVKSKGTTKPGYRKLSFCCKQAAADDLHLFWVDTCCIDKASSAELSLSINSMFKWYQKADKCYVFLSDLSIHDPVEDISQETWAQMFQTSRWFKRGWTLQELLASPSVDFFSKEGTWIGNKMSLMQALQITTLIPVPALQGSPLSLFSVDDRISWADGRETKCEEDAAYSLLGIFDIHMPLIYGEGRRKAFARLRRKINRSLADGPFTKSALPLPRSWTVPFRRDNDFINRDSLQTVCRLCAQPAGRAALVGLGGVGKSQIAIEYAYRVRDLSPSKWVFWVHAETRARFEEGYRRIAEATKMKGWDDTKVDVLRLVRSWLCDESNGQWTMVVDNADDAGVLFEDAMQSHVTGRLDQRKELLSDFLPQSPNGSILITSRSQDVARKLTDTHSSVVQVRPMEMEDALALLNKKLPFATIRDEAICLIRVLDAMPLALTQAAAFISQRSPRMGVLDYADKVGQSDKDRACLLEKDVGDNRRDGRALNSIIATWQISFEHIRKQTPTAARLLSLMSMFDRQGIPESLLHNQYDGGEDSAFDFDDDIHVLSNFSLIEVSADGREFEMHRLVQFSTKKWLGLYGELEMWKGTYSALMDVSFPVGGYEHWLVYPALFPHVQAMVNSKPKVESALKAWASVLDKAAWYARETGQLNKAQELVTVALDVRKGVLGAEHPYTLSSLYQLGVIFIWQGQYSKAEAVHQEVVEARKRVLGQEHLDTLNSVADLALTYNYQGRWKDAEELQVYVIKIYKEKFGEDYLHTLAGTANLASTYSNQGRWKDAEELQVYVIKIYKEKFGEDHPHTLASTANLASMYSNQGRWKDAEELQVYVLKIYKEKFGEDHPHTLASTANLASTYSNQGRWKDAEELQVYVLKIYKEKFGEDHPHTLASTANLASTYWKQGRWKDAEELQVYVMKIYKEKFGEDHPHTLASTVNLAFMYSNQGRWKDAEELQVYVIKIYKEKFREDYPHMLASTANLASTYSNQGRWKDAEELQVYVLKIYKEKFGEDYPHTLASTANLASTYWKQGRWKDAEELFVQVMAAFRTTLGEDHRDMITTMGYLAIVWDNLGRHVDAMNLMKKSLQLHRRCLGVEHPETISCSKILADWETLQLQDADPAEASNV